ncbi:MAG TPA: hypothetical protein VK646_13010 [Actinomycetota bacterium]|nr:hypothetical protein [Actinomycetota bacterium]
MRGTLDRLISIGGLILAVVLLIGAGLLLWTNRYITNEVHDQLAAQKITMPTDQTGLADLPAEDKAALEPYAGQQMTTGNQAKAYADHFIAFHLTKVADGKTYSEVSGAYIASCSDPSTATSTECETLSGQRATLFQGETLRGLLLYGSAFATMGTLALYGAIVAFVAAVALFVLAFLGFRHARKNAETAPPPAPAA